MRNRYASLKFLKFQRKNKKGYKDERNTMDQIREIFTEKPNRETKPENKEGSKVIEEKILSHSIPFLFLNVTLSLNRESIISFKMSYFIYDKHKSIIMVRSMFYFHSKLDPPI